MRKQSFKFTIILCGLATTILLSSLVEARRLGGGGHRGGMHGGGGFSRHSPAAGGGFSSRHRNVQPVRQPQRKLVRPTPRIPVDEGRRDKIRDNRQDRRDSRQDYRDDHWDDHHHYYGAGVVATGAVIGASNDDFYDNEVPCDNVVVVSSITYYDCDNQWYKRAYERGQVVYIKTTAPKGH